MNTPPTPTPPPNPPAFPSSITTEVDHPMGPVVSTIHHSGMTLRDYLAAKALQGLLANHTNNADPKGFASDAYVMADAMLAERDKK